MTTADNNTAKKSLIAFFTRAEVLLFLALWLSYGMLINAKNIEDFGQASVEAIVDQHRFSVENLSVWQARGDFFGYNGHLFMNKQPGQAMICAVAYAHLRILGFSYASDKLLTGALVIFLSTSLLTALAGVALFRLARDLDGRRSMLWPLAAALAFGWGTTAFAYSGVAHHDAMGTAFLVFAVYLIFLIRLYPNEGRDRMRALLGGLFLGLTLTTSMLLFFMVVIVGIYFLALRRWKLLGPMVIGGLLGVLPMLFYNTVNFGNPLSLPMTLYTSDPDDSVFFSFDWTNFLDKLHVYYAFINWYDPVLWFGLIGLIFLVFGHRREALTIAGVIAVLVFYVTNIKSLGTCNYGPRYLLPIMPFASLGVIGLNRVPTALLRGLVGLFLLYVGVESITINFVGAMGGAMFCNIAAYAYPAYLDDVTNGRMPPLLLFSWLLPLAVIVLALVILRPFLPNIVGRFGRGGRRSMFAGLGSKSVSDGAGHVKGRECSKCGSRRVKQVPELIAASHLEQYACAECGFVELYVRDVSILTRDHEKE